MISTGQIAQMSHEEKVQTMEAPWVDLSRNYAAVESPAWREKVVKETKARVASGQECIADWEEAKQELRKRFA